MDSLQLSELQTFFSPTINKEELNSKKLFVEPIDCQHLDLLDPILERALDLKDFMPPSTPLMLDNQHNQQIPLHLTQNSRPNDQQSSLTQAVLDANTLIHGDKYNSEASVLPQTMLNFLEPNQSPGGHSDFSSYYSDDSNSTAPTMHHDYGQHTSPPAAIDAPSTSNFQWPSFGHLKHEDFTQRTDDFPLTPCQVASNQHPSSVPSSIGIEGNSFPYVTSPTASLPSPSSTIYSASSPGTPGPSTPNGRGRRPHHSSMPYSNKSRRRTVEKGSQEYVDKRARNNVAVRKSRAKAKAKQHETEGRVQNLLDQNDQLQKKVDLLTKELNVLKGLFLNIGASLPDEFLSLVQDS